jgi:hypothetical protein
MIRWHNALDIELIEYAKEIYEEVNNREIVRLKDHISGEKE